MEGSWLDGCPQAVNSPIGDGSKGSAVESIHFEIPSVPNRDVLTPAHLPLDRYLSRQIKKETDRRWGTIPVN